MSCLVCRQSHCDIYHSWGIKNGERISQIVRYRNQSSDDATQQHMGDNTSETEESKTQDDIELSGLQFGGGLHLTVPSSGHSENNPEPVAQPCQLECMCKSGCVYSISDVDIISECRTAEFYDQAGEYMETCHGTFLHSEDKRNIYMIQFSPLSAFNNLTIKMVSLGARQSLWLHSIHITITQSHQNASRFSVQNVESMCRSMGTDIQSFPPSTRVLMQAMQQAVTKNSSSNSQDSEYKRTGALSGLMQMFMPSSSQPGSSVPSNSGRQLHSLMSSLQTLNLQRDIETESSNTVQNTATAVDEADDVSDAWRSIDGKQAFHSEAKRSGLKDLDLCALIEECVSRQVQLAEESIRQHVTREIADMEARMMERLDLICEQFRINQQTNKTSYHQVTGEGP